MTAVVDLRDGDILRVTYFGGQEVKAWVRINSGESDRNWPNFDLIHGQLAHFCKEYGNFFIDSDDEFECVPADKVPDKIIAKLARLTLMGELQ